MAIVGESSPQSAVTEINGVSLFTRAGKPRSRFSDEERLRILGATSEDLDATIELFCPRRPLYAMTRSGSADPRDWTTPRGRLSPREVLRHLQGDAIPVQAPRWVAPKSWEVTKWVGIDVDFRGDRGDFRNRCRTVFKALNILGVTKERRLVSQTPSGGIHVRFFLTRVIKLGHIPQLLGLVGLHESPGQVELFPKMTKGMRLPFGSVPGKKHDPTEWLKFIRAYRNGQVPLVNWLKCMRRAERHAEKQLYQSTPAVPAIASEDTPSSRPVTSRRGRHHFLGIPKRLRNKADGKNKDLRRQYLELISKPCSTPETAETIWRLGIQAEGTRVAATKKVAWHLLRTRRLPVSVVRDELTSWVYETGAKTSKDVQQDAQRGTRQVEAQTASIIDWVGKLDSDDGQFTKTKIAFSQAEIDVIINQVRSGSSEDTVELTEFALRFLGFAKLNGEAIEDGWTTQIAVNGIIRKWPRCSGGKYKPKMDLLAEVGLIEMTKEKRQSPNRTGRPRTYKINVPPSLATNATMSIDAAVEYTATVPIKEEAYQSRASRRQTTNDTYKRFKPLTTLKKTRNQSEEAAQAGTESEATWQQSQPQSATVDVEDLPLIARNEDPIPEPAQREGGRHPPTRGHREKHNLGTDSRNNGVGEGVRCEGVLAVPNPRDFFLRESRRLVGTRKSKICSKKPSSTSSDGRH